MDEETLKKVVLHSVATALAKRVFPVPGGPTMRTPCREPTEERSEVIDVKGKDCCLHQTAPSTVSLCL